MKSIFNKSNGLLVLGVVVGFGLVSCGGGNTTAQNMPAGGTAFFGTLSPGVGNSTNSGSQGCTTEPSELVTFSVPESGVTAFVDNVNPSSMYGRTIFSGTFNNPVNQNNPCFSSVISASTCTNIQSAKITFSACTVNLIGNSYRFTAIYTITANGYTQTGNVNASK